MRSTRFVSIGTITATHGLDGEVLVDGPTRASLRGLTGATVWVVPPAPHARPFTVIGTRDLPKGTILTLEGVADLSAAERLRGRMLLMDATLAPEIVDAEAGQDLLGFEVIDETRGPLGQVESVIVTGANDVLEVVGGPFGAVLIPVIEQVILDVDGEDRRIAVRLLDGLLEG